jgi:hypothetical protein
VQEILVRVRKHKAAEVDDHSILVTDLGLTMADGGERIEKSSISVSEKGVLKETKSKPTKRSK